MPSYIKRPSREVSDGRAFLIMLKRQLTLEQIASISGYSLDEVKQCLEAARAELGA